MSDDTEPQGRAKGGHARAARLTPEERSAIAAAAAKKRWENTEEPGDKTPRVLESFKSNLEIAGSVIPCAVVMGPNGVMRVLSETGITNAVLGERSGASKRLKKASWQGPSSPSITLMAPASCGVTTPAYLPLCVRFGSKRGRRGRYKGNS